MYHFALLFKRNNLIYYIYTILIGRNQRLLSILSDPYQKRFTPLFAPYHPRIEVPSTEFGTELVRIKYAPSPALSLSGYKEETGNPANGLLKKNSTLNDT